MIVCLCRAASERHVLEAIDDGAATLADLQRCGIGDQCGGCHGMLRKMLAAAAEERAVWTAAAEPPLWEPKRSFGETDGTAG